MSNTDVKMVVQNIELDKIEASEEFNCRGPIAPIDVIDLAKDIERNGLIQPAVVCAIENSDRYKLIAGFRRFTAHKVLERDTIPCVVRSDVMNDADARVFNLAENLKRKSLNILQEAVALKKLKNLGVTDQYVADRLGMSRGWVQVRYMLLDLPKEIQIEAGIGTIKQTNIRELHQIWNNAGQDARDRVLEAAKEIKEGRARGRAVTVNPNKKKPSARYHRKRADIFDMMEHIQDSGIGNGLWTRCLAWCAGEISNDELYMSLEEYARASELNYSRPV